MHAEFTSTIVTCLWLICTSLAIIGSAYASFAAILLGRFFAKSPITEEPIHAPLVTILKPLCGAEPELEANLASFCHQIYPGQVQIVLGIQDAADPAAAIARRLISAHSHVAIDVEINAQSHGANRKISNVLNSVTHSRGDIIVLSDSDIRVGPDYLRQITDALHAPGVGLVTCLYRGLPITGVWSRLAAAEIDHRFLPSVLVGLRLGLAKPCFGSTMALRAETLRQVGGFAAFADQLADDYAIGAAVRRLGLEVAIPPMVVDHVCSEHSFVELARRELRWARTIRLVDPLGYRGSVVTHPLPFALVAAALQGFAPASLAILGLVLACGLLVPLQFTRSLGGGRVPIWLTPVRDLLSFAIFLAAFLPWRIMWRGRRYKVSSDGTLTPA
ncbi:MAG: bacteriohopanetetrol glucosamine biosynthesis glycosyltransferase HpnI [Methyloceanibacter sp.]